MFLRNRTYLINHKNTMHITKSNQNTVNVIDLTKKQLIFWSDDRVINSRKK